MTDAMAPAGVRKLGKKLLSRSTFAVYQNDVLLGYQWARLAHEGPDGVMTFELVSQLSRFLPAGRNPVTVQATVRTNAQLAPLSFEIRSTGKSLAISIANGVASVEMPDGAARELAVEQLDGFIDHRFPFLTSLIVSRALSRPSAEKHLNCFLVSQLLPLTYTLTSRSDGTVVSSLGEVLELGDDDELISIRITDQRFLAELTDTGPEHPEPNGHPSNPRYTPPTDQNIDVVDLEVDGPVVPLAATLTKPRTSGAHPAVLFIAGSGSADRHGFAGDIDTGTHEIVDGLTANGFVGLRYDKRGIGGTSAGPDLLDRGFVSSVADAEAALAFLRAQPCVDLSRVAVIGHSEGGLIALSLAARVVLSPAAVVLLACPGRAINKIIEDQIRWAAAQAGSSTDQVKAELNRFRRFISYVQRPEPWTEATVPADVYAGLRQRRWLSELLALKPTDLIAEAKCPVLIIQGDRDQQISPDEDAQKLFNTGLQAGVRVELRRYKDLDHLLKPVTTDTRLDSYSMPRSVDPTVIREITDWLRRVLPAPGNQS